MSTELWGKVKVEGIWLKQDKTKYDITEFRVGYQINHIPFASVSVAMGTRFSSGATQKFDASKSALGEPFDIVIKADGKENVIFTGYVAAVKPEKSSNPYMGQLNMRVDLIGLAGILQTMNPMAYRYFSPDSAATQLLLPPDESAQDSVRIINDNPRFMADILPNDLTAGVLSNPGQLIVDMATGLQNAHESDDHTPGTKTSGGDKIAELVRSDNSTFVSEVITGSFEKTIPESISEVYIQAHTNTNTWDAILATANHMFLMVAPRVDHMLLTPAFHWNKKPDLTLKDSDILRITKATDTMAAINVVNAVLVAIPGLGGSGGAVAIYPPFGSVAQFSGKAAVITSFPKYLQGGLLENIDATPTAEGTSGPPAASAPVATTEPNKQEMAAQASTLANLLAKVYFASTAQMLSTMSLIVKWNALDLLEKLGYLIEVKDLGAVGLEDAGFPYYGILDSLVIACRSSPTDNAAIAMELGLICVRHKDMQYEYALDKNPLYDPPAQA